MKDSMKTFETKNTRNHIQNLLDIYAFNKSRTPEEIL